MTPHNAVAQILWSIGSYVPNYRVSYLRRPLYW